ncbi:hypothetical protein FB480_101593 [Agrobacterium vitis]|nr:hypothetical protein FB480_101593 [Agrobacterium vitis]
MYADDIRKFNRWVRLEKMARKYKEIGFKNNNRERIWRAIRLEIACFNKCQAYTYDRVTSYRSLD